MESRDTTLAEAKTGCTLAWQALFHRYKMPLYVYIQEMVRHEQTSFDLVQETFLKAFRHLGSLKEENKFGSWLFGIAHQLCIQHWRKQGRMREWEAVDENLEGDEAEVPDQILIRDEDQSVLLRLLEQLPLPQRSALILHFFQDLSLEEIAEATQCSVGTVKSRLHYAKKSLRILYENSQGHSF